jgi:PAS domain S-box-containing protein
VAVLLTAAIILGLLGTLAAWQLAQRALDVERRALAETSEGTALQALESRLGRQERLLRSASGLFSAMEEVGRDDWRRFVAELDLPSNFPGLLGIGYSEWLLPEEVAEHEARVRAEGYTGYAVHPPGERLRYSAIVYLEPFEGRNLRAFGFDMWQEPVRHEAMARAVETGLPSLSGRVTLVQEDGTDAQHGFLLYHAIYEPGTPRETPEQRWAALRGWIYSPFRAGDLVRATLAGSTVRAAWLWDGPVGGELLYASRPGEPPAGTGREIVLAGRAWTLQVEPVGVGTLGRAVPWLAVAGGLAGTVALSVLVWGLGTTSQRAHALALRMSEASRLNEERFRGLLESAPDAMVISDPGGRIVLTNAQAERLLGYSKQEMEGMPVERLLPPSLRERHGGLLTTPTGPLSRVADQELSVKRKDGSELAAELSVSPLPTESGSLYTAAIRDLTERRRLEEQKRRAEEAVRDLERLRQVHAFRTEFINTAAHELRTPLVPIRAELFLLKSGAAGLAEQGRRSVEVLDRNVARLGDLVDDLLDAARFQAGRLALDRAERDLHELARDAVDSFRQAARERGVMLAHEASGDGEAAFDPARMAQVLYNLLANAIRFTPAGGQVVVRSGVAGGWATLEVQDTGAGLRPEDMQRLFQPFVQVHPGPPSRTGSGLGLYISRGLVELHGGSLTAASDGPGRGSRFTARWPARDPGSRPSGSGGPAEGTEDGG